MARTWPVSWVCEAVFEFSSDHDSGPPQYSGSCRARVAARIETSWRRDIVEWTKHEAACGLETPEQQDELLARAADEQLTVARVRKAVRLATRRAPEPARSYVGREKRQRDEPDPVAAFTDAARDTDPPRFYRLDRTGQDLARAIAIVAGGSGREGGSYPPEIVRV